MSRMTTPTSQKTIEPVSVWHNGTMVNATIFQLHNMFDDLATSASFTYFLQGTPDSIYYVNNLVQGQLVMSGADYEAWQTNDQAFSWAAKQLNIVITGDYEQPTPPIPPQQPIVVPPVPPIVQLIDPGPTA